jgi:exodeoxyribonuclease V beta subunit
MRSFNVLDGSQVIRGKYFLQASAGTGKTFAIEQIVARLLLEENRPYHLPEILIVTFTREAVRDLKNRLRTNLESLLNKNEWDYVQKIWTSGRFAFAQRQLADQLLSFDRASIYTIHGFCHRMLQEHSLEGNVAPFQKEKGERANYTREIGDWIDQMLQDPGFFTDLHATELQLLSQEWQRKGEEFIPNLINLLEKRSSFKGILLLKDGYRLFQNSSKILSLEDKVVLSNPNLLSRTSSSQKEKLAYLVYILEKGECSSSEYESLLDPKFFKRVENALCDQKKSQEIVVLLKSLQFQPKGSLVILYLSQLLQNKWKEIADYLFSPDEILKKMETSLENPLFVQSIRNRYRAMIVDEFQDTDKRQWKILSHLFLPSVETLYFVGDPKQSIYGFRNADLKIYFEAQNVLSKDALFSLNTNFRSTSSMVSSLNALFSKEWIEKFLPQEDLLPLLSGRQKSAPLLDEKGSFHFFIAKADQERKWPSLEMEQQVLFPFIVQEIMSLKLSFDSYAILIKDRFQGERLHHFLQNYNIPCLMQKREPLESSEAFFFLKELLHLFIDPRDESSLKKVLASPFFSCSHLLLKDRERVGNFREMFYRLFYQKRNLFSLLKPFLVTLPQNNNYPSLFLEDLESLASFLFSQGVEGPKEALEMLENRANLKDRESGENRASPREAVRLLTIHGSKGLEFDVVFALSVVSRHSPREELVTIDEEWVEKDEANPLWLEGVKNRQDEKLRQFYVALTRARWRTYVPWINGPSHADFHNDSCIERFIATWAPERPLEETLKSLRDHFISFEHIQPFEKQSYFPSSGDSSDHSNRVQDLKIQAEEKCLAIAPSYLLSFSSLQHSSPKTQNLSARGIQEAENRSEQKPPSLSVNTDAISEDLPSGAEVGDIFHRILQKALFVSEHLLESLIENQIAKTLLQPFKDQVFSYIQKALCLPLPLSPPVCLRDLSSSQIYAEMEFTYPQGEHLIRGFIDLVFVREHQFYFLDWKTHLLKDYQKESLKKVMEEENYFLQASLYKEALIRYFRFHEKALSFGGAFYVFLRGGAIYSLSEEELSGSQGFLEGLYGS